MTPSPLAVTVTVAEVTAAVEDATSVSVDVPLSELSGTGLLLQNGATPAGSPLKLRVTAPLNQLLPVSVKASVAILPCTIDMVEEATASVSVGGGAVTVTDRF